MSRSATLSIYGAPMTTERACALCLKVSPLRSSHFLPKALYRLCRSPALANPNPVAVGEDRSHQTSRQAAQSLLCGDCEQSLSAGGERYVIGNCYRPNSSFPIRETVLRAKPDHHEYGQSFFFGTHVADLDLASLKFFAASVFWRASVVGWSIPPSVSLRNYLGEGYQEEFRRYLHSEQAFPQNARLLLWVSVEHDPPMMVSFPEMYKRHGFHAHSFYIPGLHFWLLVGALLPKEMTPLFRDRVGEVPVFTCNSRQEGIFPRFASDARHREREFTDLIRKAKGATES